VLIGTTLLGGSALAGQGMGDTTRRLALVPASERMLYTSYFMIVGSQLPSLISAPLAGLILQKYGGLRVGCYGIYELLILCVALMHLVFLVQASRMRPISERPINEILREAVTTGLMRIRDVIASAP